MKYNKERGITLVALIITIILLIIIASIGFRVGGNIIKTAQLENMKTNMLLIQAKTKEYVEEVSFKKGPVDSGNADTIRAEIYETKAGLINAQRDNAPQEIKTLASQISDGVDRQYYYVPKTALQQIGLNNIEEGEDGDYYMVGFDEQNVNVEVYHTIGFKNNGQYIHSLTDLEQIEEVK